MHYFLPCYLPELRFELKPEIDPKGLLRLFRMNLSQKELKEVNRVRALLDLYNLRFYLLNEPFLLGASLKIDDYPYLLESEEGFDQEVFDFLNRYPTVEEQIHHFPLLISSYYHRQMETAKGFIREFFIYDWTLWVTLISYTAKKRHLDLIRELQFENPQHETIALLLSQKDSEHFEFPEGFEGIDHELEVAFSKPDLERRLVAHLRFDFCEQQKEKNTFSFDYLLAYFVQVLTLIDLHEIEDEEMIKRGKNFIHKRIQEIE